MCAGRLSRAVSFERGPLVPSSLPTWRMNLPSGVNCRIWSPSLLPPTQTLPSLSICIPCSFLTQFCSAFGPPQWRKQVSLRVEFHDGGAALQHLYSGGFL